MAPRGGTLIGTEIQIVANLRSLWLWAFGGFQRQKKTFRNLRRRRMRLWRKIPRCNLPTRQLKFHHAWKRGLVYRGEIKHTVGHPPHTAIDFGDRRTKAKTKSKAEECFGTCVSGIDVESKSTGLRVGSFTVGL